MKRLALLPILCLLTAAPALHASPVDPLLDGFKIKVGNTDLSTNSSNLTFDSLTGVLTYKLADLTETYTFAEASAPGLIDALSITRTCVSLNVGNLTGSCPSNTVSVTDVNVLNSLVQGYALVGVTLQAAAAGSAYAGGANLNFASLAVLGGEQAIVGYQDLGTNSPVPEPESLTLVLSGVLGIAAAARRRLRA